MVSKLKIAGYVAFVAILCSTGVHVVGLLTDFWFAGSSDIQDSEVQDVRMGLWHQTVTFNNGTEVETETSQLRKEVQFIVMAVAGMNAVMCFILLFKNIHLCVGLIAFIVISLMILSAFYTFEGISSQRDRLQEIHTDWPELKLSWSFFLVFLGLIANILSTMIYLACLLIRGEMKAEETKLGQFAGKQGGTSDKTPILSTVTSETNYVNYAYKDDSARAQWPADSISAGYASPSSVPDDVEICRVENATTSSEQPRPIRISNSVPKYSHDNADFSEVSVITESSRL